MNRRTTATFPVMATIGVLVVTGCGASGSGGTLAPSGIASSSQASASAAGTAGAATTAPSPEGAASGTGPAPSTSAPHLTESNPPGDIPDKQVYVAYTPPAAHFSVTVPEGWARTVTGTTVTFTDKLNTISLREVPSARAPTPTSVTAAVVPQLQKQVPAFAPGMVTTTTRKGGAVVLVTFQGDSAPDPVTNKVVRDAFERYAFWNAGHEAIVTLSGPTGADNVDPWKIVTDSLRWQ